MVRKPQLSIGLDIGEGSLKLVVYDLQAARLSAWRLAELNPDPTGKKSPETQTARVREALAELFANLPLKRSRIRITMSMPYNNLFVVRIPAGKDQELRSLLHWELEALLPEDPDTYDYDFQILEHDQKNKTLIVLTGAFPKTRLAQVLALMEPYAARTDSIEIATLPAYHLCHSQVDGNGETFGLLQMGASHTTYTITSPTSYPEFLNLPFGGQTLSKIIARSCGVPYHVAEELRENGLQDPARNLLPRLAGDEMLITELNLLVSQIIRANWHHQVRGGTAIQKLVVTGGLLNDRLMGAVFRNGGKLFQIPCVIWEPLAPWITGAPLEPRFRYRFAAALGAALRDCDAVPA